MLVRLSLPSLDYHTYLTISLSSHNTHRIQLIGEVAYLGILELDELLQLLDLELQYLDRLAQLRDRVVLLLYHLLVSLNVALRHLLALTHWLEGWPSIRNLLSFHVS